MEKLDKDLQQRVWQRVQKREQQEMPPLQRDNLKPFILEAQENLAAVRHLQLQLIGKQWEPLRGMERELTRMIHTLRGICTLRGEKITLKPAVQPKDVPRRSLEKGFHRQRRLWEEMERRASDPEFAPVFRRLCRQGEDLTALWAELMGKLE